MGEEQRHSRISMLLHLAVGVLLGALSPFFGRGLYALGAVVLIAMVLGRVTERIVGKRGVGWWLANGLLIYLLAWFDTWIFVANYF